MRYVMTAALRVALAVLTFGCGSPRFNGPTVDAFTGRLVQEGKPITFPAEETVQLKVIHDTARSFGVPIATDGTFKVGWMPMGKYSALLIRKKENAIGGPNMYNLPDRFEIVEGKTEYEIELGSNWKP
jgi:hypothetical protein